MKYAILFGFNYRKTNNQLPDCELDSDNFEKKLVDYKIEKYYQGSPQVLLDYVNRINQVVKLTDTVLIQFSGHGTTIPSRLESDNDIEAFVFYADRNFYYLTDKDFNKIISLIKCKTIVIGDLCYSGGLVSLIGEDKIVRSMKPDFSKGELFKIDLPQTKDLTKRIYLLSSSEQETSESTGKGGLFTNSILKNTKDSNKTVNQVYNYSLNYCKGKQTPQLLISGLGKNTKIF